MKVSEGRGGGAPDAGAEIPLQPMQKTTGKPVVPLQLMGIYAGADIHTEANGGPHIAASGYAQKEAAAHRDSMQDQAPGRTCDHVKNSL